LQEISVGKLLKALNFKRIINVLKVETSFLISKILKQNVSWGLPYIFTAEPGSLCNLKCPLCVVGNRKLNRFQGLMPFELLGHLINEIGDYLIEILLFNQGEPFLHPEIIEFIRLSKNKNIYTTVSTNGHFLTNAERVRDLIQSRLDVLIISLDGATAETYTKYRQDGNFQQVLNGLKLIQALKHQLNARHPEIYLQFLVTKQNEAEISAIQRLAQEIKIDRLLFKTLQVESLEEAHLYLPEDEHFRRYVVSPDGLKLKRKSSFTCGRPWRSSVLLADGQVIGCCFDKNAEYPVGQLDQKTQFKQIWYSKNYAQLRNQILSKRTIGGLCGNCTEGVKIYHT
jgi:MoaA/NifB/PqqE/SkfB family radical SAM enzyme